MVVVRPATSADEPRLDEIDRATWSPQVSPGPPRADDVPFFRPRLAPEDVLVAEQDGELLGFAAVTQASPMSAHAGVLVVNGLGVAPAAQGAGVGRALIEAAVEQARARGARKLTLRVLGSNTRALALYERAGFVVEGTLVAEYLLEGRPVDDLLMALHLDADQGED